MRGAAVFSACVSGLVIWWAALACGQESFNIFNSAHPLLVSPPSPRNGSVIQFGFSVAFHTPGTGESVILVGAPRDSYDAPTAGITEPGVVYRCSTTTGTCTQLLVDTTANSIVPNQREQKSYMRMGHSLASSGANHPLLVCAPHFHLLWTCDQTRENVRGAGGCFGNSFLEVWDPTGKCVVLPPNLNVNGAPRDYVPCRPPQNPIPLAHDDRLRFARGALYSLLSSSGTLPLRFNLLGFSLDVITNPTNANQSLFSAGGPSYIFNEGQQYRATLDHQAMTVSDSRQFGSFESHLTDNFFAYSVAQGNIYGNANIEMAVGMPRGQSIMVDADRDGSNRGEVRILNRATGNVDQDLVTPDAAVVFRVLGDQVAEHFGNVVQLIDTNADGYAELFVAAPMYSLRPDQGQYDNGRVAIFQLHAVPQTRPLLPIPFSTAVGVFGGTARARLGSAIASLGDLDYDGYNDVAISAPYEDSGVVYVYMGSQRGIRTGDLPVQRVASQDGVVGFGFSLTTRTDVDRNGFADLAGSGIQTGQVLMFKARPVITVRMSIIAPRIFVHTNRSCSVSGTPRACFTMSVCAIYTLPPATNLDATITYSLQIPPRLSFAGATNTEVMAAGSIMLTQFDTLTCVDHQVLVENNLRNPCSPAALQVLSWNLVDMPSTETLLTPLLTRGPRPGVTHTIEFVPRCDTCVAELTPSIETSASFELDVSHDVNVAVRVMNTGNVFVCRPTVTFNISSHPLLGAVLVAAQTNGTSGFNCSLVNSQQASCEQTSGLAVGGTGRFILRVRATNFGRGISPQRTVNVSVVGSSRNERSGGNATTASIQASRRSRVLLSAGARPTLVQIGVATAGGGRPLALSDLPASFLSFLTVINEGPGAVPPHVISATFPTHVFSGEDMLYLTGIRASVPGITCAVGTLLDPQNLVVGNTTDLNGIQGYPVAVAVGESSRRLPCSASTVVCAEEVLCTIPTIQSASSANISWAWRVNNRTLRVNNVTLPLNIGLSMRLGNVSDVEGFSLLNVGDVTARTSVVITDGTLLGDSGDGLNIWIIIGAILGAVALFLILVLLLWKAGFFKRKRREDFQQSESGDKMVEAEADNEI